MAYKKQPLTVLVKRFWARVGEPNSNGCMEWIGARFDSGYGDIGLSTLSRVLGVRTAHQAAWILQVGPLTPGLELLHSCDNPPCVCLDHLSEDTHSQNMVDAWARGRMMRRLDFLHASPPLGERNGNCKLTDKEVAEIRDMLRAGSWSQSEIGSMYGVTPSLVSLIKSGHRSVKQ